MSLGERLDIMTETAEGLLARTYLLISFPRPPALNAEIEKVCQKLERKFPDIPEGLDKVPGHSVFRDRSIEICASLDDFFLHTSNLQKFSFHTLALLNDISTQLIQLELDLHYDIMSKFMNLFVTYTKMVILASSLPSTKEYVASYDYAHQLSKAESHKEWPFVKGFVAALDAPVQKLRDDLTGIAYYYGQCLKNISELYVTRSKVQFLKDQNAFYLIDNPSALGISEDSALYRNLLDIPSFHLWIVYGYLICPQELKMQPARDLLGDALGTSFTVPVYRNVVFRIHEHYETLFANFKYQKFKLSKYKDVLKTSTAAAMVSGVQHASTRRFLKSEIQSMVHLLTDFPGVIGPKMDIVLAALSMVKEEVLYYFSHYYADTKNQKQSIVSHDDTVSDLIYLSDKLTSLVLAHSDIIKDFACEYIISKRDIVVTLCDDIMESVSLSSDASELLKEMLRFLKGCDTKSDFAYFRDLWTRLCSSFATTQSSQNSRSAKQLLQMMTKILFHSRNIDAIEDQLKTHASMHHLWYYKPHLVEMFNEAVSGNASSVKNCISMVKLVDSFKLNIHEYCPEDQVEIEQGSLPLAEHFIHRICDEVEVACLRLYRNEIELHKPTQATEAANRVRFQMQKNAQFAPYPGFESYFSNRKLLLDLNASKQKIQAICQEIRKTAKIQIYDHIINPQEYLFRSLVDVFRKYLRLVMKSEKHGVERPSLIAAKIDCWLSSFDFISEHINLELKEVVKYVLFDESYDRFVGTIGNIVDIDIEGKENDSSDQSVVRLLCDVYVNVLNAPLGNYGILFSDIAQGFVGTDQNKIPQDAPEILKRSLQYMHTPELKHLCRIIGPYGLRYIERRLLALIYKEVRVIKEILEDNKQMLPQISARLTQTNVWSEGFRKLKSLDQFVAHSVKIGYILKFRKMLFSAFSEVMEEKMPFLYETVSDLQSRLLDHTQDLKLRSFFALGRDLGLGDATCDVNLLNILRQFKGSRSDSEVWKLLPEMYGFFFVSKLWNQTDFLVKSEAHTNNGHCVSETIRSLIVGFNTIVVEAETTTAPTIAEIHINIRNQLIKFIRFASYSILHMHIQKESWKSYDLTAIQMFLQHFVLSEVNVDMSDLEDTFPFTILRTSNIQLSEQQTESGKAFLSRAEINEEMDAQ